MLFHIDCLPIVYKANGVYTTPYVHYPDTYLGGTRRPRPKQPSPYCPKASLIGSAYLPYLPKTTMSGRPRLQKGSSGHCPKRGQLGLPAGNGQGTLSWGRRACRRRDRLTCQAEVCASQQKKRVQTQNPSSEEEPPARRHERVAGEKKRLTRALAAWAIGIWGGGGVRLWVGRVPWCSRSGSSRDTERRGSKQKRTRIPQDLAPRACQIASSPIPAATSPDRARPARLGYEPWRSMRQMQPKTTKKKRE